MELKDFVKQALVDVLGAVAEAQAEGPEGDGSPRIAPRLNGAPGGTSVLVAPEDGGGHGFLVEFDLAVTATDASELKAGVGAKLSIIPFTAKAETDGKTSDQRVISQRIKFAVPVRYPQTDKRQSAAHSTPRAPVGRPPYTIR